MGCPSLICSQSPKLAPIPKPWPLKKPECWPQGPWMPQARKANSRNSATWCITHWDTNTTANHLNAIRAFTAQFQILDVSQGKLSQNEHCSLKSCCIQMVFPIIAKGFVVTQTLAPRPKTLTLVPRLLTNVICGFVFCIYFSIHLLSFSSVINFIYSVYLLASFCWN